ncbi:MAG: DUF427 domain-containing protein [Rhodobacter sp.]|nr:DUF427 domain-containing protein [Rhodobacter sp.]
MSDPAITLSDATIHNPAEPRHFMSLKPVTGRVRILMGNLVLADSTDALRVLEVGEGVYDPVVYMPKTDVRTELHRNARQTHCPLKGDAVYFDLDSEESIAWSYPDPHGFASGLAGRVAFYTDRVTIEESPTSS